MNKGIVGSQGGQPSLRDASDAELTRLASKGNDRAFVLLYERHYDRLVRRCSRMLDSGRAEDIVHDAFEKAYRWMLEGGAPETFGPWMTRVAHNLAIDELRRAKALPFEAVEGPQDELPSPVHVVEQRENVTALMRRVHKLPKRQRAAFVAREIENRSFAEIAADLDTTEGNVRKLNQLARAGLRDRLAALLPIAWLRSLIESLGRGGEAGATAKMALAIGMAGTIATGAGVVAEQQRSSTVSERPVPAAVAATRPSAQHAAGALRQRSTAGASAGRATKATHRRATIAPPTSGKSQLPKTSAGGSPVAMPVAPGTYAHTSHQTDGAVPRSTGTAVAPTKTEMVKQHQAELKAHRDELAVQRKLLGQQRQEEGRRKQAAGQQRQRDLAAAGEQRHKAIKQRQIEAAQQRQQAAQERKQALEQRQQAVKQEQAAAKQQKQAAKQQKSQKTQTAAPTAPPPG